MFMIDEGIVIEAKSEGRKMLEEIDVAVMESGDGGWDEGNQEGVIPLIVV
jgi:type IV secretory pathway VirJ component